MSSSVEKPKIILSCEHAGNDVPEAYKHLFASDDTELLTHRGYDIGALEIARFLSDGLKTDLYYTTISRLVVEANRSVSQPDIFSRYSGALSDNEKEEVLEKHYYPYRKKVTDAIESALKSSKVIHLSIHTFTPVLNGEVREADIGILYDPGREYEAAFCEKLMSELKSNTSQLNILANSPYQGTADGFTTYLRTITDANQYAGVEIEINQKFFTDHEEQLEGLKSLLLSSIRRAALGTG